MKGAKGSGWVWRKRERGNVLNVLEGAIVARYELLVEDHRLIQVAPTFAHLGAEHCFFLVIVPVEVFASSHFDPPKSHMRHL